MVYIKYSYQIDHEYLRFEFEGQLYFANNLLYLPSRDNKLQPMTGWLQLLVLLLSKDPSKVEVFLNQWRIPCYIPDVTPSSKLYWTCISRMLGKILHPKEFGFPYWNYNSWTFPFYKNWWTRMTFLWCN